MDPAKVDGMLIDCDAISSSTNDDWRKDLFFVFRLPFVISVRTSKVLFFKIFAVFWFGFGFV